MDHSAFHALLNKYLEGKCTIEEARLIHQWYELLDDERPYFIHPEEWDQLEIKLWANIEDQKDASQTPEIRRIRRLPGNVMFHWVAAAAIIVMAGVLSVYSFSSRKTNSFVAKEVKKDWVRETNHSSAPRMVTLEDRSTVSLQPGGTIEYPRHFAAKSREVFLDGEAFFDVKRDTSKAFFVYNHNLVTEVLGTSFNIKIKNNKIEVLVKTGRVAVYENGKRLKLSGDHEKKNKVIITPNQKVIYDNGNRHLIATLVDKPVEIKPANISFKFDETPVSEVLKAIETTYGIEISLENDKMKLCPFSGDISQHDLYTKLALICQAFQASYEIKGVTILIRSGRECN